MLFLLLFVKFIFADEAAENVKGKIIHVRPKKENSYVVIDVGNEKGLKPGDGVCFIDPNTEADLFCAQLHSVKKAASAIILTQEQIEVVQINGPVRILPALPEAEGEETSTEETAENPEKESPPSRKSYHIYWPIHIIAPVSYSLTKFSSSNAAVTGASVWESSTKVQTSFVGVGFKYGFWDLGSYHTGIGFQYSFFPKKSLEADYDLTSASSSITTSVYSHLYEIFYFAEKNFSESWLWVPAISYLISQVKHSAKTSDGEDVGAVSSSLNVVSLKNSLKFQRKIGEKWKFFTDLDTYINIFQIGKKTSGTSSPTTFGGDGGITNLETALDHKKNTFGLGLSFGAEF